MARAHRSCLLRQNQTFPAQTNSSVTQHTLSKHSASTGCRSSADPVPTLSVALGPLVDQRALADALNSGRIAGAAMDVLSKEPPPADNPLLTAQNCLITPHLAWATRAARSRLMKIAVENVRAFLQGRPQNVVG